MEINYALMRKNMLTGQLQTNGITDSRIVAAFGAIPREVFMPEGLRGVAYVDEDTPLPGGGFMPEPMVLAKMVAGLRAPGSELALIIGDMTGYVAAILSQLVTTVVTLETRAGQMETPRRIWQDLDICNIAVARGAARRGCPEHAPYDVIMICGGVEYVPGDLLRQLANGGRLCAVIRGKGQGMGRLCLFEKDLSGRVHDGKCLADAAMPLLDEFETEHSFVF